VLRQLTSEVIFDETPSREGENKYFVCNASATETSIRGNEHALCGHKILTESGDLDGAFAEWDWDGNRLEVRNDPLGIFPLFYHASDNCVAVSPSLPELIRNGISREKDLTAIGVFLRTGMYLGDDTPFKHIRALPAGATLTWRPGNFTLTSSPPIAKRSGLSWDDAVDGFIDLFRDSMDRRLTIHGRMALPLSGGRDSRFIFLELLRNEIFPDVIFTGRKLRTYDFKEDDLYIAREVAARANRDVVELPISTLRVDRELRRNYLTSFSDSEGPWLMSIAEFLSRESIGTIYDGLNGGVLTGEGNSNIVPAEQLRNGKFDTLARSIMRNSANTDYLIDVAKNPELSEESSLRRVTEELLKHCTAPDPESSFLFHNRVRRHLSNVCYGLQQSVTLIHIPFLDIAVWKHLMSLDAELFQKKSFRTEAISRVHPSWADIPYSVTIPPQKPTQVLKRLHSGSQQFMFKVAAHCTLARLPPYCRRIKFIQKLIRDSFRTPSISNRNMAIMALYLKHLEEL